MWRPGRRIGMFIFKAGLHVWLTLIKMKLHCAVFLQIISPQNPSAIWRSTAHTLLKAENSSYVNITGERDNSILMYKARREKSIDACAAISVLRWCAEKIDGVHVASNIIIRIRYSMRSNDHDTIKLDCGFIGTRIDNHLWWWNTRMLKWHRFADTEST
jgi:hypothetical protein